MNSTRYEEQPIEPYLDTLHAHLGFLTPLDRAEIVREIRAHIDDSIAMGTPARTVLQRLGPPSALAAEYGHGALLRKASQSHSPLVLLRAALRLATKGVSGLMIFLLAITGYTIGASLLLTGILKPFFSGKTGVWVHNGNLDAAGLVLNPPPQGQEVMGWGYTIAALALGILVLLITTPLIRLCLRWSQRVQARLQTPVGAATAL